MVLDTSAVIAVQLGEPGYQRLLDRFAEARTILIGAPTLFETAMVLTNKIGPVASTVIDAFLKDQQVQVVSFHQRHYRAAMDAFLRYGKGRHRAALNLADCMSYATAAVADLPLLFIGDDFSKTDIRAALL
jgi:ribonuclease VapC